MALEEGQIKDTGIKSFKDPKGFAAFVEPDRPGRERDFDIQAVGLVGDTGKQTGTLQSPFNVQIGDLIERLEIQMRITNLHLAEMSGQDFKEEDV